MIVDQPPKFRSKIIDEPGGMRIIIPIPRVSAVLWGFIGSMFGMMGGLIAWQALTWTQFPDLTSKFEMVAFGLSLFIGGLGLTLYAIGGRTVLTLKPNCLIARKEICRIGWPRSFDASELFNLRYHWIFTADDGHAYTKGGIIFEHRGNTYRFGVSIFSMDPSWLKEAEYLVAQIKACYPNVNQIHPERCDDNYSLIELKIGQ